MITTSNTVNVTHTIDKFNTLTYAENTVHLELLANGVNKIINNPTVVSQVLNESDGLITFSNVPLELNGNKISIVLSDNSDLDTNNTYVKLGSGYIRRLDTPITSMEV